MSRAVVIIASIVAAVGCGPKPPSAADYVARIAGARSEKDALFNSESEPVPEALKRTLLPLLYYAIDPAFDVAAAITPSDDRLPLQMIYSDGAVRSVRRVGMLRFSVEKQQLQLAAFVEVGASERILFVPFGDLTNGSETYPGGRLLDIERTATGLYDLDFNRAYNPSCYFSPKYSCPIPPKENRLSIAVKAGERIRSSK